MIRAEKFQRQAIDLVQRSSMQIDRAIQMCPRYFFVMRTAFGVMLSQFSRMRTKNS